MSAAESSPTKPPNETWQEIAEVVDALAKLAQSDTPSREFYHRLLEALITTSPAEAATVWSCEADTPPRLLYAKQVDGRPTARVEHEKSIAAVAARGRGEVIDSQEAAAILQPVVADGRTVGVIEAVLNAESSPNQRRGVQELLTIVAEVAADFHTHQQLRQLRDAEHGRSDFDRFTQALLNNLEVERLAYAIANEGVRLIGCDRVGVVMGDCLRAVSGVDSIERRSSTVRDLETIAGNGVTPGGNWHARGTADAPPAVTDYMARNETSLLGLLPFASDAELFGGTLIVECFGAEVEEDRVRQRAAWVAEWSAPAVAHARQIEAIPLLWLGRRLAKLRDALPRSRAMAVIGVLVVAALVLSYPAQFYIDARGELQPLERQILYAPSDGVVFDLPAAAEHEPGGGDALTVSRGDVVIQLENAALDLQLTELLGEQATAKQQLDTIAVTLESLSRSSDRRDKDRFQELTAKRLEIEALLDSLAEQIKLARGERNKLALASRLDGQVLTWDVVAKLRSRPVRQGQQLATIINADGAWRIELYIPDKHIGYVHGARQRTDEPLAVSFLQIAEPNKSYVGSLADVALSTEVVDEHGASVRATVDLRTEQTPKGLRPGATVVAKIDCGRRSLAFVWLHDLVEAIRTRLLF